MPTNNMKDSERIARLWEALKLIGAYQSTASLRRHSEGDYGLDYEEALEMAYENVILVAKTAIRGMRKPKDETRSTASTPPATGELPSPPENITTDYGKLRAIKDKALRENTFKLPPPQE